MSYGMKPDVEKHRRWQGIIREAARSGLSIREFCRRRRIKEAQFYWWQRRLKQRRRRTLSGRARSSANGAGSASFALVSGEAGALSAGIELVLGNGQRLRISQGVDEATLRTVLASLEAESC